MKPSLSAALAALALVQGAGIAMGAVQQGGPIEREVNAWPFVVGHRAGPAGSIQAWSSAGALAFSQPAAGKEGVAASGFRPFWVQLNDAQGELRSAYALYPLFSYVQDDTNYRWSIFELIRRKGRRPGAPAAIERFGQRPEFEVFPFWLQRDFDEPELNYRALFPFYGTIRSRFGFERVSWTLFPFHVENEKRGAVTTHSPWPFLRVTRGAAQGWGVWPIYSTVERPGVSSETYALWPLVYRLTRQPTADDPPGSPPHRDTGVLPFYASRTGPGYVSETYLWPFFGYTLRSQPYRYSEQRYLWPLLVQGRGDDRYVNRWAPFYSHSIIKGYDKQWFAWPLLRYAQWTDEGVARTRQQFLYFLYWHEQQRAAGRTDGPAATLTHVWPLFSHWDNGAGRRQWQLFSPLEVFFPGQSRVRQVWSPILSLARHDERAPDSTRTSLLWNAVTWENRAEEERQEFHLGPLLGITRSGAEKRVAVGNGVFGFHRPAAGGWRMFWFEFSGRRSAAQ
jgi:hypothetical protein